MTRLIRFGLIWGCALFLATGLPGQEKPTAPDAQAILKKTREVYQSLESYHFVHELIIESKKPGAKDVKTGRIQMEAASENVERQGPSLLSLNSDRLRLETKGAKAGFLMVIGNGIATLYTYGENEYMKGASLFYISSSVGGSMMIGTCMGPFEILNENGIDQIKTVRTEKLTFDKQEHPCHVIEGTFKPKQAFDSNRPPEKIVLGFDWQISMLGGLLGPDQAGLYTPLEGSKKPNTFTLWIDQKTHLLLKSQVRASCQLNKKDDAASEPVDIVATDTFSVATINTALPKELFQFKAPAGAKQIPNVREGKPK